MTTNRPTLLSSCAAAATAKEAAFRIDAPRGTPRAARVVALDEGADVVVQGLRDGPWLGSRFLRYAGATGDVDNLPLDTGDGEQVGLQQVLDEADMVLMVATTGAGATAASTIGMACALRGIMTAGLVLGDDGTADAALRALRPHARVLLVSRDPDDVAEVLAAVGA
jgi:hypothetical protein